ncbi:hypothetical protein NHF48_014095 [Sphingomonas sp. H160509]|uniref:hypothetical protein n=1 Tax=Sphingomonas sp. H160509 TaxID=2955313 RepID=UPI0020980339|nr:hypothetical protein [Sphingomonas sp. H160509]MDD1451835.1 hypothetical protein [Sphingomonas sp. H160509]
MPQPLLAQTPTIATPIGTPAGTPIVNTAGLRYDADGTAQSTSSNTVTIIVAERLDVALVRDGQGAIVVTTQPVAIPFTLTNLDNGAEAFTLAASMSPGMATLRTLVIDTDGDGRYDAAKDVAPADSKTPLLAPGQSIKLLAILVATPDGGTTNAVLTVTARSTTGSGTSGNSYPGAGDGGGDAVVGPTGALATVSVPIGTGPTGPVLLKSQSVRAADGSQNAVRDAVITYTLEARFTDAVTGARIADPIPAGTVFVPGSLTLDGAPLSDGADGDAGRFDASGTQGPSITVALGHVAAASAHTVQFKAKIQ